MEKLLLIDGNSILNRAFYGLPLLSDEKGRYTNAVFGFLLVLLKTLESEKPTKLAVAFDRKAPTFRHQMFEEYKGTRSKMPEELVMQLPIIREVLDKMNISYLEQDGIEADDILGTLADLAEKEKMAVSILSGDRDLLQLATDTVKILIPSTKAKKTETKEYFAKDVLAEYEVTPQEFIELKGLMGDKSDNIPGIAGVGIKTATEIIKTYHTIENAYTHMDELKKGPAAKLRDGIESARLSKVLATIKTDCDLAVQFDDFTIKNLYNEEVYALFQDLKFHSLLPKLMNQTRAEREAAGAVTADDQPELPVVVMEKLTRLPAVERRSVFYLADQGRLYLAVFDGHEVMYYEDDLARVRPSIERLLSHSRQLLLHDFKAFLHAFQKGRELFQLLQTQAKDQQTLAIMDVSLLAYLVSPNESDYSIEKIGYQYSDITLPPEEEIFGKGKNKVGIAGLDRDIRISYLAKAAQILWQSGQELEQQVRDKNLYALYAEIELPLAIVLKDMEAAGVQVKAEALTEYSQMLGKQIAELETKIYGYAGKEFNINSPKQLGEVLFEDLKLKSPKKGKTGYSTAADVLEKLKKDHPIIEYILDYRAASKLKSTYADGLFDYIQTDGRIHTTYKQTVAGTGRLSSIDPNLQNIPIRTAEGRAIRKAFVAKEGYSFVGADYSQIELRLLAHLSEDEIFLKAYWDNADIHRMTASQVFHTPFDEVTDLQRRNAKAVNFGIVYGISDYGLSQDLNIPVKEAREYIENYFTKYPKVKAFLDKSIADAKESGYSLTMFNRIRPIPELKSSQYMVRSFGERIAMNAPIQGGAADIIKIAMNRVYLALEKENIKGKIVLQVHDELILEVADEDTERAKALLTKEMAAAAELKVPLIAEGYIAKNWYEAH
ncbi:DNA polymerase I [Clostridiales bacterium COT073_COT-073]|nr:DNA polymerase I [Clostridiales bacterium COT073_COT-073]